MLKIKDDVNTLKAARIMINPHQKKMKVLNDKKEFPMKIK